MTTKQINAMLKKAGINPNMPVATERGTLLGISEKQEADMVQLIIDHMKGDNKLIGEMLQKEYNLFKGM